MPEIVIECRFTPAQLDLMITALDQMSWRDMEMKNEINRTLAMVQAQRTYGKRTSEWHCSAIAL